MYMHICTYTLYSQSDKEVPVRWTMFSLSLTQWPIPTNNVACVNWDCRHSHVSYYIFQFSPMKIIISKGHTSLLGVIKAYFCHSFFHWYFKHVRSSKFWPFFLICVLSISCVCMYVFIHTLAMPLTSSQ